MVESINYPGGAPNWVPDDTPIDNLSKDTSAVPNKTPPKAVSQNSPRNLPNQITKKNPKWWDKERYNPGTQQK